ncbi:tumor necrosis factor receptor superfamily member 10B-like isoform X2 [Ostrea edulis]|nr:tumor necrosis factor receptor superfamily member 10B-like isoform X2 [Ostrea edulis]XP_056013164.1 tumor necrosis factor receptor superfamily member 10B-like isoform X2 [Ostrea edulis]
MVILFMLSLAIVAVADGKGVYCEAGQNEYYVKQWGQCKSCDRCPREYGLDSKSSVNMDPVYGALDCRRCLKCVAGKTFKTKIGYGECRKCTNCTAEGKDVASQCTTGSDAVCTKFVRQERIAVQSDQSVQDSSDTGVDKSVQHNNVQHNKEGFNLISLAVGIVVLVVLVPLSVVMIVKNKEKLYCWKGDPSTPNDVEEHISLKRKDSDDAPATLETEIESVPLKTIDPSIEHIQVSMRPHSVVSEDMPPLASNFRYSLKSNLNLRADDVEMDAGLITDRQFYEVPTDKELQRICSDIAHDNHYARLGRELGVKDSEIQRIKEEQKGDLREVAFQTLKKWREMNGNSATKLTLQQALKNVQLSSVCASLKDDP